MIDKSLLNVSFMTIYENFIMDCTFHLLKGYASPKSSSCFCLHFRRKDDAVISILVQTREITLLIQNATCLYVSGETPIKWGVSSGTSGG